MPQNAKQAWNEVGDRFASLGRHLSDHYKEAGSGQSAKEAQRKLEEAARQIGNQLDRAFSALDGTLRDAEAKKDLKDVVPVHLGHHQVQHDRVGVLVERRLDPPAAAVRGEGLVALLQEGVAEHRPDHVLVIDHKHPCHRDHLIPPGHRHGTAPTRVGR